MVTSAYVHIPFCKSKCKYCTFVSFNRPDLILEYSNALIKDISVNYMGEKLKTLYFGGGTPSLLPVDLLKKIISMFKFSDICELTIEVNPDDASLEYFSELKRIGVNRISMGAQTFNDDILKLIGRRHNSTDIFSAVYRAKQAGFDNISVDFIYGLPTQNLKSVKEDLDKYLGLGIQHVSTYGLKIDKESFWGEYFNEDKHVLKYPNGNEYLVPDDDLQADMYEGVNKILEKNGYLRYEVSNFAKKGFESCHNLNYWNNAEYYGFGTSASGYVKGIRYTNYSTIEEYMDNPITYEIGKTLSNTEKLQEEIFLGFRKTEGINIAKINEKYGIDFEEEYKTVLEKYSEFLIKTENGYALTLQGVLVSNVILSEFI